MLGKFGHKIAICSNIYEIWHLVEIELANYEYDTWNWRSWPKIIDSDKFVPALKLAPTFMKCCTHSKWNMLIMNITLAMVESARVIIASEWL